MMKRLGVLSIPALLWSNQFNLTLQEEIAWLEEETYVVSASRVKESIKKTPASVSVIDEEMIAKTGADNIMDLLSIITGLGITQSNVSMKEIESRGIKDWFSQQILFMIDGHSLDANLLNGGASTFLGDLKLENIKQIEVIKGPASALYGANAFTAIINMITKKASDIDGIQATARIGSYNTREMNLLYGEKFEDLEIVANLNFSKSDGNDVYVLSKNASSNPYREQLQSNLKLNYQDFYVNSFYNTRENGPYFGPIGGMGDDTKEKYTYFFIETGLNKDINKDLNVNTRVYYDFYEFDNLWDVPLYNLITINGLKNSKIGIESLGTYKLNEQYTLLFGAMYEKQKQFDDKTINNGIDLSGTANSFASNQDRNMKAIYINNLYDLSENLRITFGVRYDEYSDFGSNTAPRGGFSWQINKDHTFKASYGEGFRAPTFEELYSNSPVLPGNPNLEPEKVKTYELTYENRFNNINNKLTYFHNNFTNIITNNNQNADKYTTKGIELESQYDLNRGSFIGLNYTYLDAKDDVTGRNLSDVAKHRGNVFVNYKINKYLNSYNHVLLKGKTTRASNDTRDDVSAYAVFNTSLKLKSFYKNTVFKLAVNNLFDKEYYHPARSGLISEDYQAFGRNFMFEMKYKF